MLNIPRGFYLGQLVMVNGETFGEVVGGWMGLLTIQTLSKGRIDAKPENVEDYAVYRMLAGSKGTGKRVLTATIEGDLL